MVLLNWKLILIPGLLIPVYQLESKSYGTGYPITIGLLLFVARLCLTFCDPMDCSMPGFPVLHYLLEFAQIHAHCVSDAI